MEQLYIWIPMGMFCISFIVRCFIIVGFWEVINVGRIMLLESAAMFFIAGIHFSIELEKLEYLDKYLGNRIPEEVKSEFAPTIKCFGEPLIIFVIGVVVILGYLFSSFSEKNMNSIRMVDSKPLLKKYKDLNENYSKKYYIHVAVCLFLGAASMLFVFFLYSYQGYDFWESLLRFYFYPNNPGYVVFLLITEVILIGALVTIRKEATLASRKWAKDKPNIQR